MNWAAFWAWVMAHAFVILSGLYVASMLCSTILILRLYDLYRRQRRIVQHHRTSISDVLKRTRTLDDRITALTSLVDQAGPHNEMARTIESESALQSRANDIAEPTRRSGPPLEFIRREIKRLMAELQHPDDYPNRSITHVEEKLMSPCTPLEGGGAASSDHADNS